MRWFVVMRQIAVILVILAVVAIVWIDIATGLWQDYVILSGLAAGLVTFVLTALIIDRAVARSAHRRWAPLTRLALTDILHALADERASEVALGKIVARLIAPLAVDAAPAQMQQACAHLRHEVVAERRQLTRLLSSWAAFLAASADATDVLEHTAVIAERLDRMRDAAIEVEASIAQGTTNEPPQLSRLNGEIGEYNAAVDRLIGELNRLIAETDRVPQA